MLLSIEQRMSGNSYFLPTYTVISDNLMKLLLKQSIHNHNNVFTKVHPKFYTRMMQHIICKQLGKSILCAPPPPPHKQDKACTPALDRIFDWKGVVRIRITVC